MVSNKCDTNRALQTQAARDWKFKIEELYYPCSETKGADKMCSYFVFAYTKCWFSHDTAQITSVFYYIMSRPCFFFHKPDNLQNKHYIGIHDLFNYIHRNSLIVLKKSKMS